MSRLYWHTRERTAELHGSERHHLGHIARGPATAAWDLDGGSGFDRAVEIMALVTPSSGSYLHGYLREAQEQERRNREAWVGHRSGDPIPFTEHEPQRRLVGSLEVALRGASGGLDLEVAGQRLQTRNVGLNTALVAGSDVMRLAAKLDGWCESHAWIEGPDREWCAGIIEQGLAAGMFRRGFWFADVPEGPRDKWSDQGWEGVIGLLRERDDGPVVLSYSVSDSFPNREIAGWEPPAEALRPPDWATEDAAGRAEWAAMSEDDQQEYMQERASDLWYELPNDEQWDLAMAGLRQRRPWGRLAPDTLADVYFGHPVTVYDLFAPDRDERVRRAFGLPTEPEPVGSDHASD